MHEHDMQSMDTWDWVWMTPTLLLWIVPAALAVYFVGVFVRPDALSGRDRWRRRARFLCRASGMTVAMMLGMAVVATIFTWYEQTELAAFAMAFGMALPMVALMGYRGHAVAAQF
jgi:MFS family permease